MNPVYIILIAIFILIFLATAILTICALPGWIKVPDNYLKILFSSLLLEVIACVFLVFNLVRPSDHKCEDKLKHKAGDNWVLLNEKGHISTLSIDEKIISTPLDSFSLKACEHECFSIAKESGSYLLKNSENKYIGKIDDKNIKAVNLFNNIKLADNSDYYKKEFSKNNGRWSDNGRVEKWAVKISLNGGSYTVSDSTNLYYKETEKTFEERTVHSFKGPDGYYYFVRLTSGDNNSTDNKHAHFIIIRAKIDGELN